MFASSVDDLLNASDQRGECGDEDATIGFPKDAVVRFTDDALGWRRAGCFDMYAVGNQQTDSALGEIVEAVVVGEAAIDRRRIELEIACVHDQPGRSVDAEADGVRNAVANAER